MSTIEEQTNDAVEEIAQTDPETAQRLVRAFEQWETAREFKKKEAKRLNEQLAARIAQFAEAMNVGHSNTSDQVLKLSVVESRWQDLEDAREERKQVSSACRDAVRASEQKIKDLLQQAKSSQLNLFNSSAEAADEGEVDPDLA